MEGDLHEHPGAVPLVEPGSADKSAALLRLALPGLLLFLLIETLLQALAWGGTFGTFLGPDPYMRLVRVLECKGGLTCSEGLLTRSNAPFGEVLHWPFLLDRLLLALTVPLRTALSERSAAIAAGYVLGPILGIASLLLLTAIGRDLFGKRVAYWVPALSASHPWVLFAFAPARPDHHGLQALLFLVSLLGVLWLLLHGKTKRGALLSGIGMGLAVWTSIEGLVTIAPLLAVLAVDWLVRGGTRRAVGNACTWSAIALTLWLGLVLDGPEPHRWAMEYDRFSVVHASLFSLGSLAWYGLVLAKPRDQRARWGGAALASAAVGAVVVGIFPRFLEGPLADMDPSLWPLWFSYVREYRPTLGSGQGQWAAVALLPGVVGLAALGGAIVSRRRFEGGKGASKMAPQLAGWVVLAFVLAWFLGWVALAQIRWAHYLHLLAPLPLAFLLVGTFGKTQALFRGSLRRAVANLALSAAFLLWPLPILALPATRDPQLEGTGLCSIDPVAEALGRLDAGAQRRWRVLAPAFWGPELMFRAGVDVVATPYHRNRSGLHDSHRVMSANDPSQARRILRERGVDLIALCSVEDWIPRVPADSAGTLYHDLVLGSAPPWMESLALPGLPGIYRVYRVLDLPQPSAPKGLAPPSRSP